MKRLGTVAFHPSLQWVDRYAWSPVVQEMEMTLSGTPVFWSRPAGGRLITLEARDRVTWLDQATADAVMAMAAQAGATFPFIWDGYQTLVHFAHHLPPAVALQPMEPRSPYHVGTIKLIET